MSHITTYQKKRFDPLEATSEDLDIRDIAHALSLMCRANGHFPKFHSVAQHCLECVAEAAARGCSRRVQLGCLLHDASEAYLSDITRPVKARLQGYREIESRLQGQIFDKWISPSLTSEEREQIFAIDDALLYHEFLHFAGEALWDTPPRLHSVPDFSFVDFSSAEQSFLRTFSSLAEQ